MIATSLIVVVTGANWGHYSYSTGSTWGGCTTPSMRLETNVFELGCGDLNLVKVPTVVVPFVPEIC